MTGLNGRTVPLESVLRTEALKLRPSRSPDFRGENHALLALAKELANSPKRVLQKLAEIALDLCRGHSAGISLLEDAGPPGTLSPKGTHFRWHAVAGQWAPLVWNTTTPRDNGPCGTVLDRNATQLFSNAHLHYPQFADVHPRLVEGLLVPFQVEGQAVGTVWVVAHDDARKFDGEDQRLLESLAAFAATAYQTLSLLGCQAKANQDLQETGRRRNEFLAMLAHELRNPLAPMSNAVEILMRSAGDEQQVESAAAMMQRQVGQLVHLVDDLLDVSRISRGKIGLRREAIELASVLRQAIEAVRPLCASLGHELTVTLPPRPTYLNADPHRLIQAVSNLLNNACKFTARGGRIRLIVQLEDGTAVIRVQDTGIGLAPEQIDSVFEMFRQGDTSLERAHDGLGVGLSLARTLVELQDGTLEARSPGVGKGSEFVVRLPTTDDAPAPPPRPAVEPESIPPPRRILVVDDNRDSADSLAVLLTLRGHETHIAHDGQEALVAATQLEPDVVLLDIGLPTLDGYEVARRIRQQTKEKELLLVALTGWGQEEDRHRSEEAGFDAHLVKPVDLGVLTKLLATLSAG